jgi:hypothetical protein
MRDQKKATMAPTTLEVATLVSAYYALPGNNVGGNFYLVLENQNVSERDIQFCIEQATALGDEAGVKLGEKLLGMTKTQRLKLASMPRS